MRKKHRHTGIYKGLLGALCTLSVLSTNSVNVYAETSVNDLKGYLGMTTENLSDSKEYYIEYINNDGDIIQDTDSENEDDSKLSTLEKNLIETNVKLEQSMLNNAEPYKVLAYVKEMKAYSSQIKDEKAVEISLSSSENTDEAGISIVHDSTKDIKSQWYSICLDVNNIKPIVDNIELTELYGYPTTIDDEASEEDIQAAKDKLDSVTSNRTQLLNQSKVHDETIVNEDGTEETIVVADDNLYSEGSEEITEEESKVYTVAGEKHTAITIKAVPGQEVRCQFNGKVQSVKKEDDDYRTVTVYHSNGLYTIYKHVMIDSSIVYRGAYLIENEQLGYCSDNDIEYQVILNNTYINPLTMWKGTGEKLYNQYMSKYDNIYLVGENENYY